MSSGPELCSSRYNFAVPSRDGAVLYNAATGSYMVLWGEDAAALSCALAGDPQKISADCFTAEQLSSLVQGGFLLTAGEDELAHMRRRFWAARSGTPIVLTITTTMDCNLGCYYCYEERSGARLRSEDAGPIVELARERLTRSQKSRLHVDWYGGEPLLQLETLETVSLALQQLCAELDCTYVASVITNGTCWPESRDLVRELVQRHRIAQVQVSFDGMKSHHDKRRRYREGYLPAERASSFERAVALVDSLVACTRVDLRFNVDRANKEDIFSFIEMADRRGWLGAPYPAVLQPARLAAYSQRTDFMRSWELTLDEFDDLRARVREAVAARAVIEESEAPDGLPVPKTSVCAALASDSVVVGAEGSLYRCGLQVGEATRAVGRLTPSQLAMGGDDRGKSARSLPILGDLPYPEAVGDAGFWENFDPTTLNSCSRCSFLPLCWGGCPKKHLEGDRHALDEQSRYWRQNLPRLIANRARTAVPESVQFSERDQFRNLPPAVAAGGPTGPAPGAC